MIHIMVSSKMEYSTRTDSQQRTCQYQYEFVINDFKINFVELHFFLEEAT